MDRGLWVSKEGCHRGEYANVLLAEKGPCVVSALQAQQIAPSSVARAVWCGSGVIVDGKTVSCVQDCHSCGFEVGYEQMDGIR